MNANVSAANLTLDLCNKYYAQHHTYQYAHVVIYTQPVTGQHALQQACDLSVIHTR